MATLLDVFNAASTLGQGVNRDVEKVIDDNARSAVTAQQLDMQEFMAQEMQKFSERTDYDNFAKDFEDDFARKYSDYNSAAGPNAYKTAWNAKLGNELMAQYKTQGNIAVSKLVAQGKRNLATQEDMNSLKRIRELEPTQENLDAQMGIINRMYTSGRISEEARWQLSDEAYANAQSRTAEAALLSAVERNPKLLSMTDSELSDWTMSHGPALRASIAGVDGKENELSLSRRKINDAAVQSVRLRIRDKWEKTNNALTENFVNTSYRVMFSSGDNAAELVSDIKGQIVRIKRMGNTELSPDQKNAQINRLESLLRPLTESASGKSGSTKKELWKNIIKDKSADIVDAIIRGKQNDTDDGIETFNRGRELFLDAAKDLYISGGMSDGLSYKEAEENYKRDYGKLVADFAMAWKKRIGEQYPELTKKIDRIAKVPDEWKKKEPFKSTPELAEFLEPELSEFLWDFTAANDFRTVSAESLRAQVDDYLNRMTSKTFEYLQANPEKAKKQYASDKGFARALNATGGDYIFTDIFGKTHAIGGKTTEEKLSNLNAWQKKDLAAVLGTNEIGELGYELTDSGNDRSSTMVYQANNALYKYGVSEDGKSPALYEKKGDGDWHEIKREKNAASVAEVRSRKAEKEAAAQSRRAAAEKVKAEKAQNAYNATHFDTMTEEQYEDTLDGLKWQGYEQDAIDIITSSEAPEGIDGNEWKSADVNERIRLYNEWKDNQKKLQKLQQRVQQNSYGEYPTGSRKRGVQE